MSLSVARPIVTEPAGLAAGADRGDRSLTNRVAKFDASPDPALSTVTSLGGTSSRDGVLRKCGAGRPRDTGDGVGVAPPRRESAIWAGRWAGDGPGGAAVDHETVDGCVSGRDALPGGRPPFPRRGPTSNVSRGPPALPIWMLWPS